MLGHALAVARAFLATFTRRSDLVLENLGLRQQFAVLRRKHPRPRLRPSDRLFWLARRRCWPRWKESLAVVRPETVLRWHRKGFRRYWRWRSRRRAGRPTTSADLRALVRRNEVLTAIHHKGIEPSQITALSPWQNGFAERFASTARRDLLDHVIVARDNAARRSTSSRGLRRRARLSACGG